MDSWSRKRTLSWLPDTTSSWHSFTFLHFHFPPVRLKLGGNHVQGRKLLPDKPYKRWVGDEHNVEIPQIGTFTIGAAANSTWKFTQTQARETRGSVAPSTPPPPPSTPPSTPQSPVPFTSRDLFPSPAPCPLLPCPARGIGSPAPPGRATLPPPPPPPPATASPWGRRGRGAPPPVGRAGASSVRWSGSWQGRRGARQAGQT